MTQKSASEQQIEEKDQRIEAMMWLAKQLTAREVAIMKNKNKDVSDEEIKRELMSKGFTCDQFIRQYINGLMTKSRCNTRVSFRTAKEYFDSLSDCMIPYFHLIKNDRWFHLPEHEIDTILSKWSDEG